MHAGGGARATFLHDLRHFYFFTHQFFVGLVAAGQFEGIGQHGIAFFYAGDDVGAAEPVGFGEVGG